MNQENFVTFDQAVKLKELGFNLNCIAYWECYESKICRQLPKNKLKRKRIKDANSHYPVHTFYVNYSKEDERAYASCCNSDFNVPRCWIDSYTSNIVTQYAAPTLEQVTKLLREKGYYISADLDSLRNWKTEVIRIDDLETVLWDGILFPSYEQAISHGITEVLNRL